jgi:hypothetical protein
MFALLLDFQRIPIIRASRRSHIPAPMPIADHTDICFFLSFPNIARLGRIRKYRCRRHAARRCRESWLWFPQASLVPLMFYEVACGDAPAAVPSRASPVRLAGLLPGASLLPGRDGLPGASADDEQRQPDVCRGAVPAALQPLQAPARAGLSLRRTPRA